MAEMAFILRRQMVGLDLSFVCSTIEHLMGALYILGVDNALIELTSQEVPIMDGSAKDFVKLILETGLKLSQAPIKLIKINKMISYTLAFSNALETKFFNFTKAMLNF